MSSKTIILPENQNSQNDLEPQPMQDPCFSQIYLGRKNLDSNLDQVQGSETKAGNEASTMNQLLYGTKMVVILRKE